MELIIYLGDIVFWESNEIFNLSIQQIFTNQAFWQTLGNMTMNKTLMIPAFMEFNPLVYK